MSIITTVQDDPEQHRTSSLTIRLGLSTAFHNKINLLGSKAAFGDSFIPQEVTLKNFVAHVLAGSAWTQGFFKGRNRRKVTFVSAQTLALDLDHNVSVDQALAIPFIRKYAMLVHPSATSGVRDDITGEIVYKTRVVFRLSQPVESVDFWETLQRGLLALFDYLKPDPACKDAARLFYGSDKPGAQINYDAVLPIEIAGALTEPEAVAEMEAAFVKRASANHPDPVKNGNGNGGELSAELVAEVERRLGVAGAETNSAGFTAPMSCPVKQHEHDDTHPAAAWNPQSKFLHCFKCGVDYNTHTVAQALGIDIAAYYARPSKRKTAVPFTEHHQKFDPQKWPFANDEQRLQAAAGERYISVNCPYLSDEAERLPPVVVIKSPMGTGKSQLIEQIIKRYEAEHDRTPRILVITHRTGLAVNVAERFKFLCYKGLEADLLPIAPELTTCINSLHKLVNKDGSMPTWDIVILEESDQLLAHLTGTTFKDNAAILAHEMLKQVVRQAQWVLALDAHASLLSYDWLKAARGDNNVWLLENGYQAADLLTMYLHPTKTSVESEFEAVVAREADKRARGESFLPTVFGFSSQNEAARMHELMSSRYGKDAGMLVTGTNSDRSPIQDFVAHINDRLPQNLWLIHTSAIGTGVDIQTPVAAYFGVYLDKILPAPELMQMTFRCRRAAEYHIHIRSAEHHEEESAEIVYEQERQRLERTGSMFRFNEETGFKLIDPQQEKLLRLYAQVNVQANASFNHLIPHFLYLAGQRFRLVDTSARPDTVSEALQAAGERLDEQEKQAVFAAPAVLPEQEEDFLALYERKYLF